MKTNLTEQYIQLGKTIRSIREAQKLSQQYVASKLNIDQSTYSRIEQGAIHMQVHTLLYICDVLDISPYILLYISRFGNYYTTQDGKVFSLSDLYDMLQRYKNGDKTVNEDLMALLETQLKLDHMIQSIFGKG